MNLTEHWALLGGCVATLVALVAWFADARRERRANLDRVGFMPWTGVFFLALFAAVLLLGLAAKSWFAP